MKKIFFLSLALLLGAGAGIAQNLDGLKAALTPFSSSESNWSFEFKMAFYSAPERGKVLESATGTMAGQNGLRYESTMGIEQVYEDGLHLLVDHSSQYMALKKVDFSGFPMGLDGLGKMLSEADAMESMDLGNGIAGYRIPVAQGQFSWIDVLVKDGLPVKLIYQYRRALPETEGGEGKPPRMEMQLSNVVVNGAFPLERYSLSRFVNRERTGYAPKAEFEAYRIF